MTIDDFKTVIDLATSLVGEIESSAKVGLLTPSQIHDAILTKYQKIVSVFRRQAGEELFPSSVADPQDGFQP